MKASSVIGLLFVAAIFATVPISPQVTPPGVELLPIKRRPSLTGATAEFPGGRPYAPIAMPGGRDTQPWAQAMDTAIAE
jgi:hypothetical protein